jgi:hypothetical protein
MGGETTVSTMGVVVALPTALLTRKVYVAASSSFTTVKRSVGSTSLGINMPFLNHAKV